jgi:hypothetical protein
MEKYEKPQVMTLGTVRELTAQNNDKCGGSGDFALPQLLSNDFGNPHCS